MFLIQYHDGSQNQVLQVTPHPTYVDYPEKRVHEIKTSPDGSVIIQRPLRDHRPRKWIWSDYPSRLTTYENLWQTLESLDARQRNKDGLDPVIQIWENETDLGIFSDTTDDLDPDLVGYTNIEWVDVKFVQVTREIRRSGGPPTFHESVVEFRVVDTTWDEF